jgi:hypothetical protein
MGQKFGFLLVTSIAETTKRKKRECHVSLIVALLGTDSNMWLVPSRAAGQTETCREVLVCCSQPSVRTSIRPSLVDSPYANSSFLHINSLQHVTIIDIDIITMSKIII